MRWSRMAIGSRECIKFFELLDAAHPAQRAIKPIMITLRISLTLGVEPALRPPKRAWRTIT